MERKLTPQIKIIWLGGAILRADNRGCGRGTRAMALDTIGVRQVQIAVSPKTAEIRKKVLARLAIMQREVLNVQRAVSALQAALSPAQPISRPIADAVMNSRNWSISVAMSHAWIQAMLSELQPGASVAGNYQPRLLYGEDNLPELFVRAVEQEVQKAHADPDYWRERDARHPSSQTNRRFYSDPKTFGP
jgi:hypothetical protein